MRVRLKAQFELVKRGDKSVAYFSSRLPKIEQAGKGTCYLGNQPAGAKDKDKAAYYCHT